MRKAFFLLALMLVLSTVNAINWTVPSEVPENSNWSFYANLSGETFDEVQVFLNGDKVYEALTWGDDFIDHSFVIYANVDKQKNLVVSFAGLNAGEHSLELRLFQNGTEENSLSTELYVFLSGSREDIQEVKENFAATKATIERLEDKLDAKLSDMDSLNATVSELSSELSSIQNELNAGDASVEDMKSDLSSFSNKLASFSAQASNKDKTLTSSLDEMTLLVANMQATLDEMNKEEPIFTGFVSFVQGEPVLALGFIGIIAAVVIYMVLRKRKSSKGELFDTGFDESPDEDSPDAHEIDLGEDESDPNARKGGGKWAFGENFAEESNEKKGFSVTDLLWKK